MTSTDSSTSNKNQNSTSESVAALDLCSKVSMTNESQQSVETSPSDARQNTDTSNLSSSEASSSFSSSASPASSSSPTSNTNDTSTDRTQSTLEGTSSENNKTAKNNATKSNNSQKKPTKNNKTASTNSSIEHSPVAQQQAHHHQFVNYYSTYMPHQGGHVSQNTATGAVPYTQIDGNIPHVWPHAMSAAAMAAITDPMQVASYAPNGVGPHPYPSTNPSEFNQQHYDQFSFGFTPAFGFGYNGNGTIDYAVLQAAQQAPHLNPQSNQWTASTNPMTTPTPGSTSTNTTEIATAGTTTNPTSSPANTTTSSNDTTSSVPSTANSETSASNSKWVNIHFISFYN